MKPQGALPLHRWLRKIISERIPNAIKPPEVELNYGDASPDHVHPRGYLGKPNEEHDENLKARKRTNQMKT